MQNTQIQQPCKCQHHHFSLKMIQKERRPNLTASTTMCRGKQLKNKKVRTHCSNFQGPMLNKDRLHATPAFILPSEKIDYLESARQILREHDRRVREADEDNEQLYVPKPRSKNMYCNVCRQNYQEYIHHIHSPQHKANIHNSDFNRDIMKLTKMFGPAPAKELTVVSTETGSRDDDDSVQIIGAISRKKVKTNPQSTFYNSYYSFGGPNHHPMMPPPPPNPFMMPSMPSMPPMMGPSMGMMNPYQSCYYPMGNPMGSNMVYNPLPGYFQQQMRNYQMFYSQCQGQYQPSINIDLFQHQG